MNRYDVRKTHATWRARGVWHCSPAIRRAAESADRKAEKVRRVLLDGVCVTGMIRHEPWIEAQLPRPKPLPPLYQGETP